MFTLCPAFPPVLLQENQALQAKQRELQAALAQSEKAARAALGQQERLESLQVGLGCMCLPGQLFSLLVVHRPRQCQPADT